MNLNGVKEFFIFIIYTIILIMVIFHIGNEKKHEICFIRNIEEICNFEVLLLISSNIILIVDQLFFSIMIVFWKASIFNAIISAIFNFILHSFSIFLSLFLIIGIWSYNFNSYFCYLNVFFYGYLSIKPYFQFLFEKIGGKIMCNYYQNDQNQKLKIMSYNIQRGLDFDMNFNLENLKDTILKENPDILCLQEADINENNEFLTDLNRIFRGNLYGNYNYKSGLVIISKYEKIDINYFDYR